MGYKKRSAMAKIRQDTFLCCYAYCIIHQLQNFSGNSLAWEQLEEGFVEVSCSIRAMNLPSELSCQLSLGSQANCSSDCYKVANQQGDWWGDRSQTCSVEFEQGNPSCLQAAKWPCITGGQLVVILWFLFGFEGYNFYFGQINGAF